MPDRTGSITRSAGRATPDGFRSMMSGFPTGVAVVTATDSQGRPWGMTCSSLCSATLDPPTLLVCLRAASPTLAAVVSSGGFAVNLLHDGARATAELFASGCQNRFDRVGWFQDEANAGPHLWTDAHAVADCEVERTVPVGDHVLVFGRVLTVEQRPDLLPLLYGLRRYSSWPVA
ncbi:flavin reductase family protein [Streptomyces sp. NBC_00690]|uniref:flavin reductase family protein n=1 Tax=Streptomyces sp. NBC_00690 TaxID=2975808 RepID=UPI002E2B9E3A|nr:flavin reductase family protein [Streptomyces sp. NBC_00690]